MPPLEGVMNKYAVYDTSAGWNVVLRKYCEFYNYFWCISFVEKIKIPRINYLQLNIKLKIRQFYIMSLLFRLPNCHFYDVTKFLIPNCHLFVVTNLSLPNCHFCELTKLSLPNCRYQIVITKFSLPNFHYQIDITKNPPILKKFSKKYRSKNNLGIS